MISPVTMNDMEISEKAGAPFLLEIVKAKEMTSNRSATNASGVSLSDQD